MSNEINVGKGKSLERALREFKTDMRRSGVIDEIKKREHYAKPSQRRREEQEQARRRAHRKQREDA